MTARELNAQSETSKSDKTLILLVEDDKALRSILANTLRMNGYVILEADSRQQAMETLNSHQNIAAMVKGDEPYASF